MQGIDGEELARQKTWLNIERRFPSGSCSCNCNSSAGLVRLTCIPIEPCIEGLHMECLLAATATRVSVEDQPGETHPSSLIINFVLFIHIPYISPNFRPNYDALWPTPLAGLRPSIPAHDRHKRRSFPQPAPRLSSG